VTTIDREVPTGLAEGGQVSFEVRAIDKADNVGPWAFGTLSADYGPRVLGHSPAGLAGAADSLTLTFNEPIDPATFSAEDVTASLLAPFEVGYYNTPGGALGVQVVGTLAYVADHSSGLRILDISNPAALVEVGYYNTPGNAHGVQVIGTLAYVADDHHGLRIIDVSDPAAPIEAGYYDTAGSAHEVQVIDTLAYVADYAGLRIIDVSVPAAPVEVGFYDTPGYALDVQVVGTLAYVADHTAGLRIIDVSKPAKPVEVGYASSTDSTWAVQVVGTLAYVADYHSGLRIIDVSDPASPAEVGYHATPGKARGVRIVGAMAYVVDESYGLLVFDVSNAAAPAEIGYYNTPDNAYGVQVVGSLAYVADYRSGLRIIKVGQAVQDVTQVDATTFSLHFSSPMADGEYLVSIAPGLTDLAGNTMDQSGNGVGGQSNDTHSVTFTFDGTPPAAPGILTLTNDTGSAGDGITTDTNPTFTWSAATDANGIARYEYRLGSGVWTATAETTVTLTLAEGPHSFEVRAVDNAGNAGPAAATDATVDLTAPGAPRACG